MTGITMFETPPVGTLKAMLWKELRECLKWAVLGLVGMAVGFTFRLYFLVENLRGRNDYFDVVSEAFGVTLAGAAIVGVLIGLAQTIPENRGDKWGFLAHRPVPRSTLFWGKAASGVLLYTVATGLPLAGALLWMSLPRHLPMPFDWRLALPNLADLLCGLVFYFAGFLTGMREARWYGSRALGIGAAFACLALEVQVQAFWQAIAVCAVGLLVVGTAAWSTLVAGGQYRAQTRTGRAAVGVAMGLGITVAGVFAGSLLMSFLNPPPDSRSTGYAVTTDGAFVKAVFNDQQIVEVNDLEGRPLERYRNMSTREALSVDVLWAQPSPLRLPVWGYRSTNRLFIKLKPAGSNFGRGSLTWYYVRRFDRIAAYDNQSGKLIGWMGPDGFSQGEAMPRPFEGPLKNPGWYGEPQSLLLFNDSVYRLDLDQRTVEKAFVPQPEEVLLGASAPRYDVSILSTYGDLARFEVISTSNRVIVQLRDGTKVLEAPRDPRTKGYLELNVGRAMRAPGMPIFLWYHDYGRNAAGERKPDQVAVFSAAGAVPQHYTVPATGFITQRPSGPQWVVFSAATPLSAQVFVEVARRLGPVNVDAAPRPVQVVPWALAGVASLLSAAAAFSRGKIYAFTPGRLRTWTAIALLLGPLGLLTMLALIEWPALEQCPACGKNRIVTSEHCEHCGEPFAAPAMDGTEVFEQS